MSNSVAGLFNEFFNSKMETFETAFPGSIGKVNDNGTVDIIPMVRGCLKNMQYEPNGSDGKANRVYGVPVLFGGTGCVLIEYELREGDPVFCIACSRDIRNWIENGWGSEPCTPVSFGANSVNDLIAIPLRRLKHEGNTTSIYIDSQGAVTVTSKKKVMIEAGFVGVSGDLVVEGNIQSKKDIVADSEKSFISMLQHIHPTAVGPSSPASPGGGVPVPEPD